MSIILANTTDKIEMVTSSTADIDYETFYIIGDKTSSPMVVKDSNSKCGTVNTATTTDISGSPAAANDRWKVWTDIRNKHATASNDITIRVNKNATVSEMIKVTLAAGWKLSRDQNGHWFVYNDKGAVIGSDVAASDTQQGIVQIAVQSDMEAASSAVLAVTPARQHFHPAHPKAWGMATVASNVPTLQTSFGISSITDTATGEITFTFTTNFSSTNYCVQATTELTATTYAVANDRRAFVRNATRAASNVLLDCLDSTATTNLLKDPNTWFFTAWGDQ